MITFREFLLKNEKSCSIVYDSFEVPCLEHLKLLEKMATSGGTLRVYAAGKEHLSERVKMLRKSFPRFARCVILDEKLTDIKSIISSLKKEGYGKCTAFVDASMMDSLKEEIRGMQTTTRFLVSSHKLNTKAVIEEMAAETADGRFAGLAKRVIGDVTPLELYEHVALVKNVTQRRPVLQQIADVRRKIEVGDRLNTPIGEGVVISTGCNTATIRTDAGASKKFFIKDLQTHEQAK